MTMANTAEDAVLKAIFTNTSWSLISDALGVAGSLYISLHTADPGEAGTALTSEATYTSYARVAVARSAGGWTVSVPTVSNTALIQFPQCTGGTNTITHFGIVATSAGAGALYFSGALSSSLAVSNGIQPQFAAGALTVTVD